MIAKGMASEQNVSVLRIDTWDEIEWDRLLLLIEEGTVIPVIGAELSLRSVASDGQPVLLTLARDLAKRLRVSTEALPSDSPLTRLLVAWLPVTVHPKTFI